MTQINAEYPSFSIFAKEFKKMLNVPCMARRDGSVTFSENKIKHVRVWELSRNVDSDQGLVLNYRILCVARTICFLHFLRIWELASMLHHALSATVS